MFKIKIELRYNLESLFERMYLRGIRLLFWKGIVMFILILVIIVKVSK